jgi:hypothetical protein
MAERERESRWVVVVTWVAILAKLPYSLSRVLWAAGVPAGIDRELLREFHSPGWDRSTYSGSARWRRPPRWSPISSCAPARATCPRGSPYWAAGRSGQAWSSLRSRFRSPC